MTAEPLRLDVGIHRDVPEAAYHADCAIEISASASALRTLLTESARHCAWDHARLNPAWEPAEASSEQQKGTILHSLLLGTPRPFRVLHHKNFLTNIAKADKADALADGLIPVLADKMNELDTAAAAIRDRLRTEMPAIWETLSDPETINEATIIFRRNGIMCRGRIDALPPERYGWIYDLKFTGRTAEPDAWSRRMRDEYLFQPALYPAAIEELRGDEPEFGFIVFEWDPPYGASVHALAPDLMELARRRLDEALDRWAVCLKANIWPGYGNHVFYAEAPGWMLAQEETRIINREAMREADRRRGIDVARRFQAATGTPAR